jgi:hypothetical protein
MLRIRGSAGGTALTGTLYEPGEEPPVFRGAPDDTAPHVWICDAFYEVESGGQPQQLGDEEIRIAFESPMPRGFTDREQAIEAARDHVRTQFARLGVPESDVDIEVLDAVDEPAP